MSWMGRARNFGTARRRHGQTFTGEVVWRHEPLESRYLLSASSPASGAAAHPAPEFIAGEILVGFEGDVAARFRTAGRAAALNSATSQLSALGLSAGQVILDQPLSGNSVSRIVTRWNLPPAADVWAVAAKLEQLPGIAYAEPNYRVRLADVQVESTLPNDPNFGDLWGLHNAGQVGGVADADIDAPEAWDITTGSSDVVVGVIDTGVDYNHPDLAANIWTNPGEIPGNGLDDDANGYTDDIHGWDGVSNDGDPLDDQYHGTHVSGTIGAAGNNGAGVVGVNWNVRIMGLKFLGADGFGSTDDAVEVMNYAALMKNRGVNLKLTSNSWGGAGYQQALADAIQAQANAGILFVAAAGNNNSNNDGNPFYPASYDLPNVISVAALDRQDARASFSNFGTATVDLGAPGVDVLSTMPGNSYGLLSGTSMATPHVAGVAALAWAAHPGLSYQDVRDGILAGVDPVAALGGISVTGGRLNAWNTLQILSGGDPDVADSIPGASNLGLSASGGSSSVTDPIGNGVYGNADVDLFRLTAFGGSTLSLETSLPVGGASMDTVLRVFDPSGNQVALDNDGGVAGYSRITNLILNSTGTYYVGVSGYGNVAYNPYVPGSGTPGSTGNYALAATLSVPDVGDTLATAYTTGLSGNGGFTHGNPIGNGPFAGLDVDLYQFVGAAAGTVTLETFPTGFGANMDTILRLFDSAGNQLLVDDDSGGGLYSLINYSLTSTGTYYVGVSGYANFGYDPTLGGSGTSQTLGTYGLQITLTGGVPEMDVHRNGQSIVNGDTTPSMSDGTNFGEVALGSAVTRQFTIQNSGSADLSLGNVIELPGSTWDITQQPAAVVAPGGSTTFRVRFQPGSGGAASETILIPNNDPDESPYHFLVQGSGKTAVPDLQIKRLTSTKNLVIVDGDATPSLIDDTDFAVAEVGLPATYVHRVFTLLNTGDLPITFPLGAVSVWQPGPFTVMEQPNAVGPSTTPISTLAPGASAEFRVRFNPTSTGMQSAIVTVASNDPDENPYDFAVQGFGMGGSVRPEIEIRRAGFVIVDGDTTPDSGDGTNFGAAVANLPSARISREFTIHNVGNAPLLLTDSANLVSLSTSFPSEWTITKRPDAYIPPGGSSTFRIRFNPTSTGWKTATVVIPSQDNDENPYDLVIGGLGLASFGLSSPSGGDGNGRGAFDHKIDDAQPAWEDWLDALATGRRRRSGSGRPEDSVFARWR